MLAVCTAFTAADISLLRTVTSQNIDHERALSHQENSLLVQNIDNPKNRKKFEFHFCHYKHSSFD